METSLLCIKIKKTVHYTENLYTEALKQFSKWSPMVKTDGQSPTYGEPSLVTETIKLTMWQQLEH